MRFRRMMVAGLALLGLLLILAAVAYRLAMPGALFLMRFMNKNPEGDLAGRPFQVRELTIPCGGHELSARLYDPDGTRKRVLLLIHGVHRGGYDEPRLVHFSKRMAAMGFAVITPDLTDLKRYEIVPQVVDDIERCARWTVAESGLLGSREKIGLLGISFSGGLCLSAAA
ncbi:MAG: hypothetical protein AB1486_19415 [Planctomycetota bacterium]